MPVLPHVAKIIHKAVKDGDLEKLEKVAKSKLFLNNKKLWVDSKDQDDYQQTPLHKAAVNGQIEIVKFLIKHGADVNMRNNFDETALHTATFHSKIEAVKCLIKYGAQLNIKNQSGYAPLHLAALGGKINIAKCLIERSAQFDIRDRDNKTPFDLAKMYGHHELATYLLEIRKEALNQKPSTIIDDKAPCIICFEPRNGFYVLYPCGHAALCEPCTYKLVIGNNSKCPNCRQPIKNYTKMFFQEPESQ